MAEYEKVLDFSGDEPQWVHRITLTNDELKYLQAATACAADSAPDYLTKQNGEAFTDWFSRMRKGLARPVLNTREEYRASVKARLEEAGVGTD